MTWIVLCRATGRHLLSVFTERCANQMRADGFVVLTEAEWRANGGQL